MYVIPLRLPDGRTPPPGLDDPSMLAPGEQIVRFGRCEIRMDSMALFVDGVRRALQPRPFALLVYLVENRDRVVTREELLARVWDGTPVQACSLPAAILRLRRGLGNGQQDVVRTYQRVGYRFVAALMSARM
jgi:DNA-binding winged helix-turn-helix (wHTH) protein